MSDVNVSFGAIDEGVAAAARRLAVDLANVDKVGSRVGQTSGKMAQGMQILARSTMGSSASLLRLGAAGGVLAGIYGAYMGLVKGAEAWAKINKEAGAEMQLTAMRAQGVWETIGKWSHDAFGMNLLSPTKMIEQAVAGLASIDPAVQQEHFQALNKEAQKSLELALARDEGERAFLKALQDETAEYEKQKELRLNMQRAGLLTEFARGNLDRSAGDQHRANEQKIFNDENERIRRQQQDRERADREGRRSGDEQMYEAFQRMDADRKSLEMITAEARIDTLGAQGKEKEARIEQLRLNTLQKIAEIKARENASDDEKRRAIEAVQGAETAQLKKLQEPAFAAVGRFTGSQTIAPGLASASLSRQVFGPDGGGAGGDRQVRKLDELVKAEMVTVELLKSIDQKMAGIGGYGA